MKYFSRIALAGVVLSVSGCDGLGTDTDGGVGATTVTLSKADAFPSLPVSALGGDSGNSRKFSIEDVSSIDIDLLGVDVKRALPDSLEVEGDEDNEEWVELRLTAPEKVNLLSLPGSEDALQIARGDLAPGTYDHIRLVFDTATIIFKQDVVLGENKQTVTFTAGTRYPLVIGDDRDDNRIRVKSADFTVSADTGASVALTFDPGTSVRRVVLTSHGKLRMQPVLHAKAHKKGDED